MVTNRVHQRPSLRRPTATEQQRTAQRRNNSMFELKVELRGPPQKKFDV